MRQTRSLTINSDEREQKEEIRCKFLIQPASSVYNRSPSSLHISPAICLGKYNQKSSMCINVQLKYIGGNTKEKILINSGVEKLLINKQFCCNNMIKLERIAEPIPIFNVDGC